jgi:hypothetical protein
MALTHRLPWSEICDLTFVYLCRVLTTDTTDTTDPASPNSP